MKHSLWLFLAAVFLLAACQPAATPAPTQPKPAEQRPAAPTAAAQPTAAPAAPVQPAPVTVAPRPTALPGLKQPISGGVLNPPTIVSTPGNNPANVDATTQSNWATYRDEAIGMSFQYPSGWQKQIEQGSQPIQRITLGQAGQPGGITATLVIEVWKKPGDLLTWLRTQLPAGRLLISSSGLEGGNSSYQRFNANLAGQPAIFLYRSAKSSTTDRAALFAADKQYIYQFTYLGKTPDNLIQRAVYLHLLNTVIISDSTTSGLSLPSTEFTTGVDMNQFK